ncbi:DUF4198 domain-containing protein [Ramlibacter sp. AN1015]|uniref:DUF4198 domain-containing protein n=1 Tax=Ramlibacter sp. AN1015 TaxID=3133428 RepID=UPI0030BB3FD2
MSGNRCHADAGHVLRVLLDRWRGTLLGTCLLGFLVPAQAHDTWLTRAGTGEDGRLLQLELGTGPRFPLRESGPRLPSVAQAACRTPGKQAVLVPRQEHATHLEMRARTDASAGAACWVELKAQDVELTPELVDTYFSEIRASPEAIDRWKRQQAAGGGWRESYRKFIRIEMPPANAERVPLDLREPQGMAMEIVPIGSQAIRTAQPYSYQLWWDGAPLANQWVEFVSERHTLGVWQRSDARGQVRLALPFGGRWLLRATRLEPPGEPRQGWRSRFATLVVHVR